MAEKPAFAEYTCKYSVNSIRGYIKQQLGARKLRISSCLSLPEIVNREQVAIYYPGHHISAPIPCLSPSREQTREFMNALDGLRTDLRAKDSQKGCLFGGIQFMSEMPSSQHKLE